MGVFLAAEYRHRPIAHGFGFEVAGVDRDVDIELAQQGLDAVDEDFASGHSASDDDSVDGLSLEAGQARSDFGGDALGGRFHDERRVFVARGDLGFNFFEAGGSHEGAEAAFADQHLLDFGFGEAFVEAKIEQHQRGDVAGSLGGDGACAEAVVDVDATPFAVGTNGDAAAEVGDDEVELFVITLLSEGEASGDGLLAEGVPQGSLLDIFEAGDARDGGELVDDDRVDDEGGDVVGVSQGLGDGRSEV